MKRYPIKLQSVGLCSTLTHNRSVTTVLLLQNWSLFECTVYEFVSSTGIVERALKFGQTTIIKPLQIVAPWRCVHVYWKGILVQRELEYTRMSLVLISREVLGKGKRI